MNNEKYILEDHPTYEDGNIRKLQNSDPANADTILNPLFSKILNNAKALSKDKVDKIPGKSLSENEYTTAEKNKLAAIADNANNYVHPDDANTRHMTDAEKATNTHHIASKNNPHGVTAAQVGASNPNILINGDFQIWQRGEEFRSAGYTADRWLSGTNATTKVDVIKLSGAPGGFRATVRVVDGIEGNNILQVLEHPEKVAGSTVTLSVDLRTTGEYRCIYIGYILQGQAQVTYHVAGVVLGARSTVVLSLAIPSNIVHLQCGVGITRAFTQSDVGTYTDIYSVKLEYGSVATPFASRTYGEELALCQRYYRWCDLPEVPSLWRGEYKGTIYFDTPMRCTPAVTVSSNGNGLVSIFNASVNGFHYAVSDDSTYVCGYTASAEV